MSEGIFDIIEGRGESYERNNLRYQEKKLDCWKKR